jgi:hypothetical protein
MLKAGDRVLIREGHLAGRKWPYKNGKKATIKSIEDYGEYDCSIKVDGDYLIYRWNLIDLIPLQPQMDFSFSGVL